MSTYYFIDMSDNPSRPKSVELPTGLIFNDVKRRFFKVGFSQYSPSDFQKLIKTILHLSELPPLIEGDERCPTLLFKTGNPEIYMVIRAETEHMYYFLVDGVKLCSHINYVKYSKNDDCFIFDLYMVFRERG
jgi:hypothetical protein